MKDLIEMVILLFFMYIAGMIVEILLWRFFKALYKDYIEYFHKDI